MYINVLNKTFIEYQKKIVKNGQLYKNADHCLFLCFPVLKLVFEKALT
jgi:hypothetical protein